MEVVDGAGAKHPISFERAALDANGTADVNLFDFVTGRVSFGLKQRTST